jgi:hypothetical protein
VRHGIVWDVADYVRTSRMRMADSYLGRWVMENGCCEMLRW